MLSTHSNEKTASSLQKKKKKEFCTIKMLGGKLFFQKNLPVRGNMVLLYKEILIITSRYSINCKGESNLKGQGE